MSSEVAQRYGPWALIAGGSEGIGSELAERLARHGINLILVARKPGPLEETAAGLRARHGVEVRTLSLDLTAPAAAERVIAAADGCEVGLLAHNAGADSSFVDFVDRPLEECEQVITLNVGVAVRLAHHFAAGMARRGRGGVLLCSSMGSLTGFPHMGGVYSAAKAFLNVFAETLWFELGQRGVDVLAVVIPLVRTPAAERKGLNFAGPVTPLTPAELAEEALAHLAHGPVLYAGGCEARADRLRTLPRAEAVRLAAGAVTATEPKAS